MSISVAKMLIVCSTVFLVAVTGTVGACSHDTAVLETAARSRISVECVKAHSPNDCVQLVRQRF